MFLLRLGSCNAWLLGLPLEGVANAVVVAFDDCGYIQCATVAEFDRVRVENFPQLASRWEVLINQEDELLSYLCLNIPIIGWVVPCNLSFTAPLLLPLRGLFFHWGMSAALCIRSLVRRCCRLGRRF